MTQPNASTGIPADARLHPSDVEAVAARVVALLEPLLTGRDADVWLTATDKARQLGVSRSAIYEHAAELGALRIGSTLRFPAGAPRTVAAEHECEPQRQPRRRPRQSSGPVELLPVRGREAA